MCDKKQNFEVGQKYKHYRAGEILIIKVDRMFITYREINYRCFSFSFTLGSKFSKELKLLNNK